jgi:hypothetical protein
MYSTIFNNDKKGQLTIFIIIAVLLVIVILLILVNKNQILSVFIKESVPEQIENCIKDSATIGLEMIELQGGAIDPENYILYKGNKIDYTCYNSEYYQKCVMQKPLLKLSIEQELKSYVEERMQQCLNSIKQSYESSGYSVSYKRPIVTIELKPKVMTVNLESDFSISKENTESYKYIKTRIDSDIYEFAILASSISNWEARYGDIETLMFMRYYPDLKVEKKPQIDGSRIYILTKRGKQENFRFAVRSIALPPGVTGN